ncbi:MAG: GNAT family N-acetyltransferase [Bacteroidota bacterium]
MAVDIQPVSSEHISSLSRLARESFHQAFADDNDPKHFQEYLDKAFSLAQMKTEFKDPHSFFFMAWEGNLPVGYIKLVKGKYPIAFPMEQAIELQRIYLLSAHQGKKIGKRLMEKALEVARTLQAKVIWLGVWEHNPKAIQFYKHLGFEEFGTHDFPMGPEIQTDLLMKKSL